MTAMYIVLGDGPPILHDQLLFHLFPILPNRLKSLSIFPPFAVMILHIFFIITSFHWDGRKKS